jgi:predicted alpha/beta-hydrolase family hydrolase
MEKGWRVKRYKVVYKRSERKDKEQERGKGEERVGKVEVAQR